MRAVHSVQGRKFAAAPAARELACELELATSTIAMLRSCSRVARPHAARLRFLATESSSSSSSSSSKSDSGGKSASAVLDSAKSGGETTPKGFTEGGGDIAFKPTENGWGYNKTYANAWDRIFAKKGEEPASAPEPAPASEPLLDEKKLGLLTAALDGGALSERLFEEAKRELERDR